MTMTKDNHALKIILAITMLATVFIYFSGCSLFDSRDICYRYDKHSGCDAEEQIYREDCQRLADLKNEMKELAAHLAKSYIDENNNKPCQYQKNILDTNEDVIAIRTKANDLCTTLQSREYKLHHYQKLDCNSDYLYKSLVKKYFEYINSSDANINCTNSSDKNAITDDSNP